MIYGTFRWVQFKAALDHSGVFSLRLKMITNMNAFDHEHPVLDFDLSLSVTYQSPFICLDSARFQRAPEGSG